MSKLVDVRILPLVDKEKFKSLTRGTPESACLDCHYLGEVPLVLKHNQTTLVPLGFAMALPPGWEAQIRSRSGLALKHKITIFHGIGTIDSDYRQEVAAIVRNHHDEDYIVNPGDKICQMAFAEVPEVRITLVDALNTTERTGGFGSTGA